MVSAARLAALIDAMGSIDANDLGALEEHDKYAIVLSGDKQIGACDVIRLFIYGDDAYKQGVADLVSKKLGDEPVAWRGHHLHPKAQDNWTYVDGAEKPKVGLGGLTDLEPLFREV